MALGKLSKSFKKVPDANTLQSLATTNLAFSHEFINAGETVINFNNLKASSEWIESGRSNPTISAILGANLTFFKNQVVLTSSSKGMIQPSQYTVTAGGIQFNTFFSEAGEVFEVQVLGATTLGNQLVDGRNLRVEGILPANTTEFSIGMAIKLNPEQIVVFRNGAIQYRNENNISTATTTGQYHMLPVFNTGLSSIVKFNSLVSSDQKVIVMSLGSFVERPTISQMQEIESLAGKINQMADLLAPLAGVPVSTLNAGPAYHDLNQFSKRVFNLENKGSINVTGADINWSLGYVFYKNITANTAFTFSNIEDGKAITFLVRNTSGANVTITLPSGIYRDPSIDLIVEAGKENGYTFIRSNGKTYATYVTKLTNI